MLYVNKMPTTRARSIQTGCLPHVLDTTDTPILDFGTLPQTVAIDRVTYKRQGENMVMTELLFSVQRNTLRGQHGGVTIQDVGS